MRLSLPGASQRRALALVPVILVFLIGGLAYRLARTVVADVEEVERRHAIIEAAERLLTRAVDAETGQRAYLLIGDTTFLDPYRGSRVAVAKWIDSLRTLAVNEPSQTERISAIERLADERFALLEGPIAQRRSGPVDRLADERLQLAGKEKMDELRAAIASLEAAEQAQLASRRRGEQSSARSAAIAAALASIAALLISGLINLAFARALEERDKANADLRQLNEDLEHQSDQLETQALEMESQAAELEATAEDLRSTNDELSVTTKAAEDARDSAEAARVQLERVLENLPDAAAAYDEQWRIVYLNPAARALLEKLNKNPDGALGKVVWTEVPEFAGTMYERETRSAQREGKPREFEEYFVPLDAWFNTTVVPVNAGTMTFTRDVTRRKREEEGARLLSDASRILASTLDYEKTLTAVARLAVGDLADWCSVELLESDGQIRQVVVSHVDEAKIKWARELNKRYPPDHSAPTGVGNVIRTGQPEIYPEIPEAMLEAGAQDEEHLRIIRELQIRSAIVVPMTARGHTLGALTLVSTERGRKYGDEDLALATELATRAAIAIDNAQLYRGALAASDAKSAFLATMSHELRTPLNAIIGYESLMSEGISGPLNEAQLAQLTRIRASADHLLGLIDEVLTFSRVEAGKEVVEREQIDLRTILDEAVAMVTPLATVKELKVRAEGDSVRVFTDPGKVRQIVLNLLSNAIKFTEQGEIVVRSEVTDGSLRIQVADPGIGIAQENLERIFDPFWQVEQRSTRKVGGTGLGLSVSRTLARLLGGDVTVESEEGKGSTFTVTLPLRRS